MLGWVGRHDDGQAEQHHVAADLGRSLRQPEPEERGVAEDRERALGRLRAGRRPVQGSVIERRAAVGHGASPGGTQRWVDGRGHRRIAALDEVHEPAFQGGPLQEHVAGARPAAQADVRAEAVHEPRVAATRMGTPQAHDVAEQQAEDGAGRHGGQAIRAVVDRGSGRAGAWWRARRRDPSA